jgi:glutathionylspermidine synthase
MKRNSISPRRNWESIVESQGLLYHTTDDGIYWNESAYYSFSMKEITRIEDATNSLQEMCLAAGQYIIDNNLFRKMNIGPLAESLIRHTWESEPPAIYGRFDLAYDGTNIKMLEYNADTPTSLLEAAVIQWYWLQDRFANNDQFNSLHESLVEKWKDINNYIRNTPIHFASLENREDSMTIAYLAETAKQAGMNIRTIAIPNIGHDAETGDLVDMDNNQIRTLFKLYPWENLIQDEFGKFIPSSGCAFIEPAWKMMWSNKALLAVLWEMYPNHELLLPAYFDASKFEASNQSYVRKPFISREGANISIVEYGVTSTETDGNYGAPFVYQGLASLSQFDNRYPVIGSWVIDGVASGMGIREDATLITGNTSQFVPHIIF